MSKTLDLEFKSQLNTTQYLAKIGLLGTLTNTGTWTFSGEISSIDTIKSKISGTTFVLSDLCTSTNINEWTIFKPDKNSPYNLGDFLGYNHSAKAPLYWDDTNKSKTIHVEKGQSWSLTLGISKGDMLPTTNLDGFSPLFMQLDDNGSALVRIQRQKNSVNVGSPIEWPDISTAIFTGDDTAGTKTLSLEYWNRTTSIASWVKKTDSIEDGNYILTIIQDGFAFSLISASLKTTYKAFFGAASNISVFDFDVDYIFKNNSSSPVTRTIYWSVWNAGNSISSGSFSTGSVLNGSYVGGTISPGTLTVYLDNPTGNDPQSGYASLTFYSDFARTDNLGSSDSYQVERNP